MTFDINKLTRYFVHVHSPKITCNLLDSNNEIQCGHSTEGTEQRNAIVAFVAIMEAWRARGIQLLTLETVI